MKKFLENKNRSYSVNPSRDRLNEMIKKRINRTLLKKDLISKKEDFKDQNMTLKHVLNQLDRPVYTGLLRPDLRYIKEYTPYEVGKFILSYDKLKISVDKVEEKKVYENNSIKTQK